MSATVLLLLNLACQTSGPDSVVSDLSIRLRWYQGYETDSWARAEQGLWWSLSQLGARPPGDGSALRVEEVFADHVDFVLDFRNMGWNPSAHAMMEEVVEEFEQNSEYAVWNRADLGRFLMRSLYEPWRYYRATGACTQLDRWEDGRLPEDSPAFSITESMLVEGHRQLLFRADPVSIDQIAWMAQEGDGSLETGDFVPQLFEVVDVMNNGQPRYALYDTTGRLIPAPSDPDTPIGQPGRCMWCHEQHLMTTVAQPEIDGSVTWDAFVSQISDQQDLIDQNRSLDESATDFENHEVHAWSELLVETFLFPTPDRIALEWGVDRSEIDRRIEEGSLRTHTSEEYPEFGLLLHRAEVDDLSATMLGVPGYQPLPTLPSARDLDMDDTTLASGIDALSDCAP